ncbi:SemiSWEET transporter [Actinoplanes sp. NPDC048967]|uniref:SemiSWEET transporter n=1 Tax=Actinoplanes sp. NPDC048967 TaxID=3155269 RepID=UPI0033FE9015
MHSIALLGWFGAALSITLPWPQVWRSVARGRTKGLSSTACWQSTAMPVGWITYGLLTGETVQVVTNTVTGVAGLAVLVTVLRKQSELRTGRKLLVSAAGAAGVLTAAAGSAIAGRLTDIGSPRAAAFLGAVLAGTAILGAIPQPLSLLRDRNQDLAGLSPLRWWLAAFACGSWCTYGLATGQPAVWLSALVGLASALIVCWVLVTDRRSRAAVATVAAPAVAASAVAVPTIAAPAVAAPATVAVAVRTARSSVRVVRPARAAAPALCPTRATGSTAAARVVRPASAAARPVYGATRAARPRPARGVATVPHPSEAATMIMAREFAPA